jgi:hypothetical protein
MPIDTSQHQVFWVSYGPAADEGVHQFSGVIDQFTRVTRYDFILCLSKPMRASVCWSLAKWRRAGAKGSVLDVQYAQEKQSVKAFILERAGSVRQRGAEHQFGSESDVVSLRDRTLALLRQQRHKSRTRQRERRIGRVRTSTLKVISGPLLGSPYRILPLATSQPVPDPPKSPK